MNWSVEWVTKHTGHRLSADAIVKYWAKKLLKMGFLLVNSRMQAEALQLLMMIYMQGKQWQVADDTIGFSWILTV